MGSLWVFLTDFGDTAVTLPVVLATLAILVLFRQWRTALAWGAAMAGAGAVIGGLKIAFAICGHTIGIRGIVSPSGHTAMSVAVYGSLAVLITRRGRPTLQWASLALALCFAAVIAFSRSVLHLHSSGEVAVGTAVGCLAVAGFALALPKTPPSPVPQVWVGAAALLLIGLFHGVQWPTERAIHSAAGLLRWIVPGCR